jgi:murein DD-endopeptidase MepM/ murein hydrolase activator NlpD
MVATRGCRLKLSLFEPMNSPTVAVHLQFARFATSIGLTAAFFLVLNTLGATTSRNHVWDISFPLEKGQGSYVQAWHDCRPSGSNCTRAHRAVDIYASPGTPVYAAADGTVAWRQTSAHSGWAPTSGSGYALYITHPENTFRHFYGHFGPDEPDRESDAFAVNPATGKLWAVGDTVTRGQLLGWVGTSGATASGPHLHFELRSMMPDLPLDDPGPDAIPGRSYGDRNAPIGQAGYLRYDPYPSLKAAEQRNDYPVAPPFLVGDFVRVVDVSTALNVRGPEACDSPLSGAGRPLGSVGQVVAGPADCDFTAHKMWKIRWTDCVVGWSSQRYLAPSSPPSSSCPEHPLSLNVLGSGSVRVTPELETYPTGSKVEIAAQPAAEFVFSHWSGSVLSSENPLSLTITGELSVTAHFVRTYEAWESIAFTPAEREIPQWTDPGSDPLNQGVPNLAVYAFGMNLRDNNRASLPRIEAQDGRIAFVLYRLTDAGDLRYVLETSRDLTTWTPFQVEEDEIEIIDALAARELVRIILPPAGSDGHRFIRLKLEQF